MLVLRLGLIGSAVSLGALLSKHHFAFDLISHFRIQYVILITLVLCFALLKKRGIPALILAGCLCVHLYDIYRSQIPAIQASQKPETRIRIMSSNLLASNRDYTAQLKSIESVDPDVIVFQEYTSAWASYLEHALHDYPHRVAHPLESPFGIALFSKHPLKAPKVDYLIPHGRPGVEALVSMNAEGSNRSIKIYGTHPPPPISISLYAERNRQLESLAARVSTQTDPVVIAGDLNITPWSQHFRHFIATANLVDARRGQGILPTWPSTFLPLQIPIDHIIISRHVTVFSVTTSSGLSSDHKTIWADLAF